MTEEQIKQTIEDCLLRHEQMIHNLSSAINDIDQQYKSLLSLFTSETGGRSIEDGLSDTQISLAKSFNALYACKVELEKQLKRVRRFNIGAFEECLEVLDKMQKAHPNGQA